jgi:hypothetical protein
VQAGSRADVCILAIGSPRGWTGRTPLARFGPDRQTAGIANAVAATGKPVVAVIFWGARWNCRAFSKRPAP